MTCPVDSKKSLLREYIRTLVGSEASLSDVQPRPWGHEFSKSELNAISKYVKTVLQSAPATLRQPLRDDLSQLNKPGLHLHWFVGRHWPTILLAESSASAYYRTPVLN